MKVTNIKDVQLAVVVEHDSKHCDVYIPDLKITVHGDDYTDALANSMLKASAIYYYNLERNLKFDLKTSFKEASSMCKKSNQFVTYINLQA